MLSLLTLIAVAPTGAALAPLLVDEVDHTPPASSVERAADATRACAVSTAAPGALLACANAGATRTADLVTRWSAPLAAWATALPGRAAAFPTELASDASWTVALATDTATAAADGAVRFVLQTLFGP
ncbi:MAG: hypothetical protein ACYDCK_04775 [Thermoplasmatota archaeon]